tara:strand:- start:400 stop:1113 length:714 start_codon:yes stop_codon:yes gene_type:complete
MRIKLKLHNFFIICFLVLSFNTVAKDFPEQFTLAYDLFQSSSKIGKINANYNQSKKNYNFHVFIKGRGIFKRMGKRHLISEGEIRNQKFYPIKFEHRNSKSPKKNISSQFFYDQKKIKSNYKGRKIEKDLLDGTLDVAIFLMQFNLNKISNESYNFKVFQGKKTRTYSYKKIKDESIEINKKIIEAELYEGVIIGKEKSVHHVWISKNNYRVPIKLTIPTDLGLTVNQVLVSTNLPI